MVRSRDHPDGAIVGPQRIEVEGQLHMELRDGRTVDVRVPVGLAVPQVAVALGIFVALSNKCVHYGEDPRIVAKPTERLVLVDEPWNHHAALSTMQVRAQLPVVIALLL